MDFNFASNYNFYNKTEGVAIFKAYDISGVFMGSCSINGDDFI